MASRDPKHTEYDKQLPPSNLETIDEAVWRHIKEEMDLYSTVHDGWRKVPVIWVAPERAYQRKKNKDLRDDDGTLILPIITIERTSIIKEPTRKGTMGVHIPAIRDRMRNQFTIGKVINQKRTSQQANARSARKAGKISGPESGHGQKNMRRWNKAEDTPVFDMITIPLPVYIDCEYTISIRTGFQQQSNEIIQPFLTRSGQKAGLKIGTDHHNYLAKIDATLLRSNNVSKMENEERIYESQIKMIVNGYLTGEGTNQETPHIVRRQTAVEVSIGRERSVFGDINEWQGEDASRGLLRDKYDVVKKN